jgi:mannose-1-phosphate guanylyltransferase
VAWRIKKQDPQANLVVAPSDHIVMNPEEFKRVIVDALQFTSETDSIVTLGMNPTRPETGYGYIKADLSSPSLRNKKIYRVDSFKEKPDLDTAKKYLKHPEYFWNSGIFVWSVKTIVNALRIYQPDIANVFESLFPVLGTNDEQAAIDHNFPKCPNISIDYAVMEKLSKVAVVPGDFGWDDVGGFGAFDKYFPHDSRGNVREGPCTVVEADDNICVARSARISLLGVKGLVVVTTPDSVLVASKSRISEMKKLFKK